MNDIIIYIKSKKLFFIDIGILIFILMRIFKIYVEIKLMISNIKLLNILISWCVFTVLFWQSYDIANFSSFDWIARINDITCTLFIGLLGLCLLRIITVYKPADITHKLIKAYGRLVIFYGFTQTVYASLSFNQFGYIVLLGVTLSLISSLIGFLLLYTDFTL